MVKIKIHHVKTGMVEVDRALLYHQESTNPIAYTGLFRSPKHRVLIPVSSYLIEHPKGRLLVDTGWHKAVRTQVKEHLGYRRLFSKPYLPQGWAIDERLAALGYSPEDIDHVLLSHLDLDHAGGLDHLRGAKQFLVSQAEWEAAEKDKVRYMASLWKDIHFTTFTMGESKLFNRPALDLFGDQCVYLVETPGHSKGLTSVLIRNDLGEFIVLASDVGYAGDSMERLKIPGILAHKAEAVNSLMWVKDLSDDPLCRGVYFNHDASKVDSTFVLG